MFKDDIKREFDRITPSDELTASISAMMREEAAKPRRPILMNTAKVVAMAAAVCLVTALSVVMVNSIKSAPELTEMASGSMNSTHMAAEPAAFRADTTKAYDEIFSDEVNEAEEGYNMAADGASPSAESLPESNMAGDVTSAAAAAPAETRTAVEDAAPDAEAAYEPVYDEPAKEQNSLSDGAFSTEADNDAGMGIMSAGSAQGGDGYESMYRISVTYPLDSIPGSLAELVGTEVFNEWVRETMFDEKDFTDLDGFINLYSFRKRYDISGEAMEAVFRDLNDIAAKNGWEPYYSEEDIALLCYADKETLSERYANDCTVYHNGRLYTVKWFDTHNVEDYRSEGIPPEKIREKLGNMMYLCRFNDPETRERFDLSGLAAKLGEYIGEEIDPAMYIDIYG